MAVRIPPSEAWPFLRSGPEVAAEGIDAPVSVVAADLLDIQEDRAETAAADLLRQLRACLLQERRVAE